MAANTTPVFPLTPNITIAATFTAANTAKDGTGTVTVIHTAGANGSRVDSIKSRALGTNVATVLRVFINNGASNAVATNNILYMEMTIAATTLSEVAALLDNVIQMNISLPAGYRLLVTIGTAVAAGLAVSCIAGDY